MEDEDWLDYVPLEFKDPLEQEETEEELLCFRKRGRGSRDHRFVPRLPLRAMIQRMKLMDESFGSERHSGGRGRARILQDRARASRPHGLHQKKQEKAAPDVQREVTKEIAAIEPAKERQEVLYNRRWQQEDFPSLGIEQTVEGSPTKKSKGMKGGNQLSKGPSDAKEKEKVTKEIVRAESPVECIQDNSEQMLIVETEVVKPKTVKKKKFDFTKANQELLQEFPIAKQSGPKIMSLTQQNLEKFLRESDTESSCSSQDFTSHSSTQENLDLPVYQRYAVTLDDIKKSKAAKVPPKVKGHLAHLLEAMDSYCDNPEKYFESKDETNKDSGDIAVHNEPPNEPPSSKNIESAVSNASVVSDMSDLSSPSENDDGMLNNSAEDVDNNVETGNSISYPTNEMGEAQNSTENGERQKCDSGKCNIIEQNDNTTDSDHKQMNGLTEKGPITVASDFDIGEEDFEGFQKVVSKHSKRKISPKAVQRTLNIDQSVWRIYGKNVIQVDGLPQKCELTELHGMVAGFGTVLDFQIRQTSSGTSIRFKLHSEDSCEYAVTCLDETDCLFPDSNCKLSCHQLQT